MNNVLLVDKDESWIGPLKEPLAQSGFEVHWSPTGKSMGTLISQLSPRCVLIHAKFDREDDFSILTRIKEIHPGLPAIMISRDNRAQPAVEAMKKGAFDYLTLPVSAKHLTNILNKAIKAKEIHEGLGKNFSDDMEDLMLSSENVQKAVLQGLVRSVSKKDINVLITGESGTGKELTARMIHRLSMRRKRPFVPVDCAAIPESLIESELFGHEKGAYTGADSSVPGKFEMADKGTIFLDEIANVPLTVQAKLLRFLESFELERVGGRQKRRLSVRVIAATNINLEELAKENKFRLDLFYRLNEFPITVPPLRERREDIPFLAKRFLQKFQGELESDVIDISDEAMQKLEVYPYPGNVRELRNIIKRAMVVAHHMVEVKDLPPEMQRVTTDSGEFSEIKVPPIGETTLQDAVRAKSRQMERAMIEEALQKTGGHQGKASKILGITPRTLYNKMKELGIV